MMSRGNSTVGPEAQFRANLRAGEIRLQFCQRCHRGVHYPRIHCPFCSSTELEFRTVSGLGTVYSTTVELRSIDSAGAFNLSLVDLDEGVRILASVVGCDPLSVRIGQRVRATIGIRRDVPVVLFKPVAALGVSP